MWKYFSELYLLSRNTERCSVWNITFYCLEEEKMKKIKNSSNKVPNLTPNFFPRLNNNNVDVDIRQ